MTRLIRSLRDVMSALVGIAALVLIVTGCVMGFTSPDRVDLIGLYLATGCGLLANPQRHGRATDPGTP